MKITIHRGIEQIGGCITEIESASGRKILIDLGHNLPDGDNMSEDEYDSPAALGDLLNGVSDIFYSHYHGDHLGFETKMPDSVTQHIGSLALKMVNTLSEHKKYAKSLEEFAEAELKAFEKFEEYKPYIANNYGGITITPLPVSHSALDAYMFLIECDNKLILHTGDFRDHGYNATEMLAKANPYLSGIDILITEGTMLNRNDCRVMSEPQLQDKAKNLMNDYKYVFVLCSSMDIDRICSFEYATGFNKYGKRIIADSYQIKQIKLAKNKAGTPYDKLFAYPYGRDMMNEFNRMKKYGFLMFVRNSPSFRERIDNVFKETGISPKECCFIYSQYYGYIDKQSKTFKPSLYKFIHMYDWHIEKLHTSGHASKDALIDMCNRINPRMAIIPIHKEGKGGMSNLKLKTNAPIVEETTTIGDVEIIIK